MTNKCRQGAPYEELSTVKVVGNNVLLLHTITASEDVVCNNSNWRMKTFESFRKKVMHVAEDYTGGIDKDEILGVHINAFIRMYGYMDIWIYG